MTAFSDETGREAPTPTRESENKYLGGRTDAELEASFANMYYGWERGLNITQERFGNGETKFTETPMTDMELAARYVAAEIGLNIFEIANKAAFAPIIVYSQIQARLGPVFERLATLSASPVAQEPVAWLRNLVGAECKPDGRCYDICFADPKDDRYRALYTSPPATPAAPVVQEPVAIKLLEWRDRGPAVHPQWEAVSVVGSYFIATIKGGQFNWWTTALRGKIEQHSLNDAKDAAQADYEKRIRSALSNPPATPAGVGADEIARLVEDLKAASESLHLPAPSQLSMRGDAEKTAVTAAMIRAGFLRVIKDYGDGNLDVQFRERLTQ